jgi:DNA repair protein RecO (recombination protein O)
LDRAKANFENFHLQFLLQLSRYLGFAPQSAAEILEQLSVEGHYYRSVSEHGTKQGQTEDILFLERLIHADYEQVLKVSHFIRREALDHIISFYRLHVENFGEIKSLPVLQEVMR